jgi:DNA polymerase I-like protein with 3'-5' exonuclease and polymerase domains
MICQAVSQQIFLYNVPIALDIWLNLLYTSFMDITLKPLVLNPPLNVTFAQNLTETGPLFAFLDSQVSNEDSTTGFDLETDVKKDFYFRRCRTVQFGHIKQQHVVDLLGLCDGDSDLLFACQGEYGNHLYKAPKLQAFMQQLEPYVTGKLLLTGVNLGFEFTTMYWNFGIACWNFFDTSVVERCIYAGAHSLKDYGYYSMEEMVNRYLGYEVDKELQTSFTLDMPLSWPQIEYAALDTRLPIAIKTAQEFILKGYTVKSLQAAGLNGWAKVLSNINPLVLGDNLQEIASIENSAIPAFQMMHIHGVRLDIDKWKSRVESNKKELASVISELDTYFVPVVGSKHEAINDEEIALLEGQWKELRDNPTKEEILWKVELAPLKRKYKKNPEDLELRLQISELEIKINQHAQSRLAKKDIIKKRASELSKKRTKINKLKASCEGDALINYASNAQLIDVLQTMYKQLSKLETLDDEVLEKFSNIKVVALIKKYHELAKLVGTYGESWCSTWVTKPCKEEGWLSPGDFKLHSQFNQMDAETGRSSSSQPNSQNLPQDKAIRSCFVADSPDVQCPDGYKIITIDCSGAELRLLAEAAKDPIWIEAFNRGEDIHSVCTALLYESEWSQMALPDCAYYKKREDGSLQKFKCKCPLHNELRNATKSANFGLCYGIGPGKLSKQIGKTRAETIDLITKHQQLFPNIWVYLRKSGNDAKMFKKAFDMFGRRRLFPEPTWELAKKRVVEDEPDKFEISPERVQGLIQEFEYQKGRKPNKVELFALTHRQPTSAEISKKFAGLHGSIERQGMNHPIQGANASVVKVCMSCLFDKEEKPFLFHILPKYNARLLMMVHDELVVQVPTIHAEEVAGIIADCIKRAAAMRMSSIIMESEWHIEDHWSK